MYSLPKLSYSYSDLEPYIDSTTMEIHHSKHHAAYVDNLNKALVGQEDLLSLPIEQLVQNFDRVPDGIRQVVINNAGGHANHTFFWSIMAPASLKTLPSKELLSVLDSSFGGFEKFKESFTSKALSVFGSGWAFLVKKPDGTLALKRHSFQNSPLSQGNTPLLGIDVWEHAYYLKYQNRRVEYVAAWWNIVNWTEVSTRFTS